MHLSKTPCCAVRFLHDIYNSTPEKNIKDYITQQYHDYGGGFKEIIAITTPDEGGLGETLEKVGFVAMEPKLKRNSFMGRGKLTLWLYRPEPEERGKGKVKSATAA